jgi:hypothetical protein
MPETVLAVLIALGFSLFLVLVTLGQKSRTPPPAWMGLSTVLYFLLLGGLNAFATLLASLQLPRIGIDPPWLKALIWAVLGVFTFEAVFKNTKLFNQDALDIRKWTETARDYAIADANARQARFEEEHFERCALALQELEEGDLDVRIEERKIEVPIPPASFDNKLRKAYALAGALDDHGAAILKSRGIKVERAKTKTQRTFAGLLLLLVLTAAGVLAWRAITSGMEEAALRRSAKERELAKAKLAGRPVTALIQGQEAAQAIPALARQVGARAAVNGSITCSLNFKLQGNRFGDVMDSVCMICSCDWYVEWGKPPTVMVDPKPAPPSS